MYFHFIFSNVALNYYYVIIHDINATYVKFNYSHEKTDEENRPEKSVKQALEGNDDFLSYVTRMWCPF